MLKAYHEQGGRARGVSKTFSIPPFVALQRWENFHSIDLAR
jgi:hypothetical protein